MKALVAGVACILASGVVAVAQDKPANPPSNRATPVKLVVTLSRYQGEKKISSMPYTLALTVMGPVGKGTLRMGSKIPVVMVTSPVVDGQKMPIPGNIQYQDVGTHIDCTVTLADQDGFRIEVTVDDTSVISDEKSPKPDQPTFRSFRAYNSMILKDGQTGQFSSAVDKVSGEVTKIDVTLTVVK